MNVVLEEIQAAQGDATSQDNSAERLVHGVWLRVGGCRQKFEVYVLPRVLPGSDASVIHGDQLLEELLRFEPQALSAVCGAVGAFRRGASVSLPLVLVSEINERHEAL